jgi:Holliday junction resolvase RusA-like endonuclease
MRIIVKKNSKRLINVRGRIIPITSKEYKLFEEEALNVLNLYLPKKTLQPPYVASYVIYMKGKQFADLDNMIASINDLMEQAGMIENDRFIHRYAEPTMVIPLAGKWEAFVTVWGH